MSGLDQLGQLFRLGRFRVRYPAVVISKHTRLGFWEAWIPAANGGQVVTRHVLADLLDKLEDLLGPGSGQARGDPDA